METGVLIIGRNQDSTWLQIPGGWVDTTVVKMDGDISLLPVTPSGVIITGNQRTFILSEPKLSGDFIDAFELGKEALAIGRNGDGSWLEISEGWVPSEALNVSGDKMNLPYTGNGILLTFKTNRNLWTSPGEGQTGALKKGEQALAIGRNSSGVWVQIEQGWIIASSSPNRYIQFKGEIMSLPVTTGSLTTSSSTTSTRSSSPTPIPDSTVSLKTGLDARTIRTLVSRRTKDVGILDIKIAKSATTIDYDLKPWPFVPNEQIANEVAFKIICAIRNGQRIPNTLKLIGQSHFKSDVGRKFTVPSVEIHISASNANRIVCRGNNASDINWRSIASRYKSYPIPRGASVDYD